MITEEYAKTLRLGDKLFCIEDSSGVFEHKILGITEDMEGGFGTVASRKVIRIKHARADTDGQDYYESYIKDLFPTRLDALYHLLSDAHKLAERAALQVKEIKRAIQEEENATNSKG